MKKTQKLTVKMIDEIYEAIDNHDCHLFMGEDGCDCIGILGTMAEFEDCSGCNEYQRANTAVACPAHDRLLNTLHTRLKVGI